MWEKNQGKSQVRRGDYGMSRIERNKLLSFSGWPGGGKGEEEVYEPLRRHEVHVLHDAGFSLRKIAEQVGMSKTSVERILKEARLKKLPAEMRLVRNVGRPSVARKFVDEVRKMVKEDDDLPSVEILHRLRSKGYKGGKSAVYELVAKLRPDRTVPMVRFEGLPGEFSQHDFGQTRVRYEDKSVELVRFFVSRLKWSRWSHVFVVPDEKVESLVRGLLLSFDNFGGVPLVCVFDNPKTIVRSREGNKIEWNPTFGQVALDFRFSAELCWPSFANQKGSVENLVGWVKNSFFKVRRFHDREDMESQLCGWLQEANTVRPSRATGVTPNSRIQEERERLRPMAFAPVEYPLRYPVFVGPTGWVEFDGVRYSMHPDAINMPGTLWLYTDRVKIIAKHLEAEHPRKPKNGAVSTLSEHTAAGLARVSGRRAKLYYQRERLLELGETAEKFLTELVHARPKVWMQDVEKLFGILESFGPEILLLAFQWALGKKFYGAEYVQEKLQEMTLWKPKSMPS
jgi:transposase